MTLKLKENGKVVRWPGRVNFGGERAEFPPILAALWGSNMMMFNGIGTTLYGKAKSVEFVGADRTAAEQHGFDPKSYQAIKWFVILFMPVVPLGTYRIIKLRDSERFNMQPVPWDWAQVLQHAGIAYGCLAAAIAALLYLDLG